MYNETSDIKNMHFILISNEIKPHYLNIYLLCIHQYNYQDSYHGCGDRYQIRNNVHKEFHTLDRTNRFYKLDVYISMF